MCIGATFSTKLGLPGLLLSSGFFRLLCRLKAVGRVLGMVLRFCEIGKCFIVPFDFFRLVLPHLRDELGNVGLGATGRGGFGRLKDLHLVGAIQNPRVCGSARAIGRLIRRANRKKAGLFDLIGRIAFVPQIRLNNVQ